MFLSQKKSSPFSFWDILILFFRSPNATSEEIELFCSFFFFEHHPYSPQIKAFFTPET